MKILGFSESLNFFFYFRKEKEFEETMDHLQKDIDTLEDEKGQLREKLKGPGSKKSDLKSSAAFGNIFKLFFPIFIKF